MDYNKLKEFLKDKYHIEEEIINKFIIFLKKNNISFDVNKITKASSYLDNIEITLKKDKKKLELEFILDSDKISYYYGRDYNLISKDNIKLGRIITKLLDYDDEKTLLKDLESILKEENKNLFNVKSGIEGIFLKISELRDNNIIIFDNSAIFSTNLKKEKVEGVGFTAQSDRYDNSIKIYDSILEGLNDFLKKDPDIYINKFFSEVVLNYLDIC